MKPIKYLGFKPTKTRYHPGEYGYHRPEISSGGYLYVGCYAAQPRQLPLLKKFLAKKTKSILLWTGALSHYRDGWVRADWRYIRLHDIKVLVRIWEKQLKKWGMV